MKMLASVVGTLASLVVVSAGCGNGSNEMTAAPQPIGTQLSLVAYPTAATVGFAVSFDTTAKNAQPILTELSIDFTDDGTWDDVSTFAATNRCGRQYSHVYDTAGTNTVRARVQDTNGVVTEKTLVVEVTKPATPPLWWSIGAVAAGALVGPCYAVDSPAAGPGLDAVVPPERTGPLGSPQSGSTVTVTQAFLQPEDNWHHYTCSFHVYINAPAAAGDVRIGEGTCETWTPSFMHPGKKECSVTVSGIVP